MNTKSLVGSCWFLAAFACSNGGSELGKEIKDGDPCTLKGQVICDEAAGRLGFVCDGSSWSVLADCGPGASCQSNTFGSMRCAPLDSTKSGVVFARKDGACLSNPAKPFAPDALACATDRATRLLCKDGAWSVGQNCAGQSQCGLWTPPGASSANTQCVLGDTPVADEGSSCPTAGEGFCSLDRTHLLQCQSGKVAVAVNCPSGTSCRITNETGTLSILCSP
jgi:hypothetical protein